MDPLKPLPTWATSPTSSLQLCRLPIAAALACMQVATSVVHACSLSFSCALKQLCVASSACALTGPSVHASVASCIRAISFHWLSFVRSCGIQARFRNQPCNGFIGPNDGPHIFVPDKCSQGLQFPSLKQAQQVTPFNIDQHAMQGNHTLVTGGYDGLIVVWNTDSGAVSAHLSPSSHKRTGLQERCIEQVHLV